MSAADDIVKWQESRQPAEPFALDEAARLDDALDHFKAQPAQTDAECAKLLGLLLSKYRNEESKWAMITEDYNLFAKATKNKMALKRAGAKLTSDSLPVVAQAPPQSKRETKKEKQVNKAKEAAAMRVAEEMPEDGDEKAVYITRQIVGHFWECLADGDLPEQEVEGIFGVAIDKRGPGEIAYSAWGDLIQKGLVKQDAVVDALVDGTLPLCFGKWIRELRPEQHTPATVGLAGKPELLAKVPWNATKMAQCAKPSAQDRVQSSVSAAAEVLPVPASLAPTFTSPALNDMLPSGTLAAEARAGISPTPSVTGSKPTAEHAHALAQAIQLESARTAAQKVKDEASSVKGGSGDGYTWSQQADEVEVIIPVGASVAKKDVKVSIRLQEVRMEAPKALLLGLHAPVVLDGCGWTLSQGQVIVTLEKKHLSQWPNLLK